MRKTRYITVNGHAPENLSMGISHEGNKMHSYSAFANWGGYGIKTNNQHLYTPAHQIVRARRMAIAVCFFVELQKDKTP